MPSFDDIYDEMLAFVEKEDLLASFSQLTTDRERAEAVLSIDMIRDYVITPSYGRKSEIEAETALHQGDICDSQAEPAKALRRYSAAVRLSPDGSATLMRAFQRRGALLHRQGHHTEAIEDAARVVDMSPSTETAIKCKLLAGSCFRTMRRWVEAEKEYQQALTMLRESQLSNEMKAHFAGDIILGIKQTKQQITSSGLILTNIDNTDIRRPELDFGKSSEIPSCSAAVSLQWSQAKGRHLVANTDIKIGSVVIVEDPYAWSTSSEALEEHCLHCCRLLLAPIPCLQCSTVNFCSPSCRELAWSTYHRFECPILDHFLASSQLSVMALLVYRTVIVSAFLDERDEISVEFAQLHSGNVETASRMSTYSPTYNQQTNSSSRTPGDLLKRCLSAVFLLRCLQNVLPRVQDETTLVTAFLRHMQSCSCNAYQINEQRVPEGDVRRAEDTELGGAVYATISLCNHSCYPNVVRHSYGKSCVVRTTRTIRRFEELSDNYGPHFLSHSWTDREEMLMRQYSFQCDCIACIEKWPTGDVLLRQKVQYKCGFCGQILGFSLIDCSRCSKKSDVKKTVKLLEDMMGKYKTAIEYLLSGRVEDCLKICIKYATFLEAIVVQPNIDLIKCQQTMGHCWSLMGNVDRRIRENSEVAL